MKNHSVQPCSLTLVEIYDRDNDHDVGGQDLPYRVTACHDGDYAEVAQRIELDSELQAFNIRPASSRYARPNHIEFLTFAFESTIKRFFGVIEPLTPEQELSRNYSRSIYARNVGELRAAIANLPDDFPLIHTGFVSEHESKNRLGVHVLTGSWAWTTAENPNYGTYEGWALRLLALDVYKWNIISKGSWRDSGPVVDCKKSPGN